ncbi:MAG: ABC transporter substrate-binding protein [Acetobacteraceae bacterium]
MNRTQGVLAALFIGAVCLTAVPSFAKNLPIGGIGTLSGQATDWGVATERGIQLAIDEVDAKGGLKMGGTTYKLHLIMYDDDYTGQGGATAATRLVTADHVKYIIGPIGSPPALATLPITTPAKVLVMHDGYSPKLVSMKYPYSFRVDPTPQEFAPAMIGWLRKHYPDAKKVAIFDPNDAVGQAVIPIVVPAYKAAGFQVSFVGEYDRGTTDFTPLLTRMMAKGADILDLGSSVPGAAGLLIKQARQVGFKGLIVQIGGPSIKENMAVAGRLANGFVSFSFLDPGNPLATKFAAEYAQKYGGVMSPYCPIMYNAAEIVFEAMQRADSIDVGAVRAELFKMQGTPTIFGPLKWGGKQVYGINHQILINIVMDQVKDGKVVRIGIATPQ